MSTQPSPHRQRTRDPFRTLAIVTVLLGMTLVIGAALFWALTGRQSSLIVGAGLALVIGGGLRSWLMGIANQLPSYGPPPPPPPTEAPAEKAE